MGKLRIKLVSPYYVNVDGSSAYSWYAEDFIAKLKTKKNPELSPEQMNQVSDAMKYFFSHGLMSNKDVQDVFLNLIRALKK